MEELKHSGTVAVVGRPSSGKSTFLNTLCGYKVSIVSSVPQTTRNRVRAIFTAPEMQVVFLDTPGMHFSEKAYNQELVHVAQRALADADVVLYFSDLSREFGEEEKAILKILEHHTEKTIVALNKLDIAGPAAVAERQADIDEHFTYAELVALSALDKEQCTGLARMAAGFIPAGPAMYPEDYYTDQGQEFRISEIIREKVFVLTRDEIPHSTYIKSEKIEFSEETERVRIEATVYVETESQKGMVIGKQGSMIKKVGIMARANLKEIFGWEIDLFLKVKVHKNWRKDRAFMAKSLQDG